MLLLLPNTRNSRYCNLHTYRKAFIPFLMAGDPDLDTTAKALQALDDAGADVLEVGIPYSVRAESAWQLVHTQLISLRS